MLGACRWMSMSMASSLRSSCSSSAQTILLCAGEPDAFNMSAYTMNGVSSSDTTAPASGPTGETRSSMAHRLPGPDLFHRFPQFRRGRLPRADGRKFVMHLIEYAADKRGLPFRVMGAGSADVADGFHVRVCAAGEVPDGKEQGDEPRHGQPPERGGHQPAR